MREHYDELNNSVFIWLNNLHLDFFDDENPNYILQYIDVGMGKDSMFYDDAKKHMSRKMRKNVDNFEEALKDCNNYIKSCNETIHNRIREIIATPVFGRLTDDQSSSIHRMLNIGFSQAIRNQEEILTAVKKWDFSSKVKTYGFTTQNEVDNAKNILGVIQQDQTILDNIRELRNRITELEKQRDTIKAQSNEISSRITSHHYRSKRRCCPSLFKELWHTFI
jgi:hypothetical protein